MNKCKLGDLFYIKQGYAFKSKKYISHSNYILCTLANFSESNNFKFSPEKATYYPDEFSHDFILSENDLIIPLTEQVVGLFGNTAFVPRTEGFQFVLNQRVGKIIPYEEKADKLFLHYLLSTQLVRDQIEATASGTKQRNTSPDKIYDVTVWIPNIDQQRIIGRYLYALEQKCNINTKVCSELEAMAKTLYDYWFVQFDFPDKNGKPYRTWGGEMVWNEQLKREIPKGWKAIEYSELVDIENSSINPSSFGETVMEHYSIPAFDEDCMPAFDTADTIQSGKYRVLKESFLVSKLNPQFKRIWNPYCLTDNAICSTEFMVYKPKDITLRPICYAIANSDGFYNHMVSKAISSTGSRKRIQPDVSIKYSLAFPLDRFVVDRFCSHYGSIMEKIKKTKLENYELKKLRDGLLPMLMNGQARVE